MWNIITSKIVFCRHINRKEWFESREKRTGQFVFLRPKGKSNAEILYSYLNPRIVLTTI